MIVSSELNRSSTAVKIPFNRSGVLYQSAADETPSAFRRTIIQGSDTDSSGLETTNVDPEAIEELHSEEDDPANKLLYINKLPMGVREKYISSFMIHYGLLENPTVATQENLDLIGRQVRFVDLLETKLKEKFEGYKYRLEKGITKDRDAIKGFIKLAVLAKSILRTDNSSDQSELTEFYGRADHLAAMLINDTELVNEDGTLTGRVDDYAHILDDEFKAKMQDGLGNLLGEIILKSFENDPNYDTRTTGSKRSSLFEILGRNPIKAVAGLAGLVTTVGTGTYALQKPTLPNKSEIVVSQIHDVPNRPKEQGSRKAGTDLATAEKPKPQPEIISPEVVKPEHEEVVDTTPATVAENTEPEKPTTPPTKVAVANTTTVTKPETVVETAPTEKVETASKSNIDPNRAEFAKELGLEPPTLDSVASYIGTLKAEDSTANIMALPNPDKAALKNAMEFLRSLLANSEFKNVDVVVWDFSRESQEFNRNKILEQYFQDLSHMEANQALSKLLRQCSFTNFMGWGFSEFAFKPDGSLVIFINSDKFKNPNPNQERIAIMTGKKLKALTSHSQYIQHLIENNSPLPQDIVDSIQAIQP